jgi:hypothetical protein
MALLIFAMWVGSIISGYYHFLKWLVIPISFFTLYVINGQIRRAMVAKYNGLNVFRLVKSMVHADLMLVGVAIIQHSALFGVGWLLADFIHR